MPAQLLALGEGPSIQLDKPVLLLGRDLECDVRFDSRKISRKHCCIAQVGDSLVVRDLGSTNGIHINGVRVVEGSLRAGDELTIGDQRYQVRWDEWAVASSRPAPRDQRPRAAAGQAPDDDMLELCDDPVPLSQATFPPVAGGPADARLENMSLEAPGEDSAPIVAELVDGDDGFPDKPSAASPSP